MSGSANSRGYSFRISAEGMREFAADMTRLSGQVDGVHQAYGRLIQASPELASALLKAEDATKRAADRTRELQQANERAAQSAASLPGQMQRAASSMDAMESRTQAARRGVSDLRGAMDLLGAGGLSSALGPVASQIGNVADAFSTASLAARAGSGALGMVVPVLGAVAAAAGGLYAAYELIQSQAARYGTEQERLNRILEGSAQSQELYRRAIESSNDLVETAEDRSIRLANARRAEQRATLEATAAEQELEAARLAARANNLPGSIAAASEDPGAYAALGFPGVPAAERENTLRFLNEQVRLVQDRTAALAAERAEIQRRIEALGSDQGTVIYARPIGPEPPRAGAAGSAGRAPAAPRAQDADAHVRAFQAAQQRIAQQQEAEERRREQALRRFEQQSLDAFARIGENALDRIGNSLVDAFLRGERAALDWGNILRGVIASAATDLIKLGLINPFTNSMFGTSRPTLGGAMAALPGAGAEAGGGGMGSLLSLGGGLSGLGSLGGMLGLGGMGAGVSGLLSTPLWGSTSGLAAGGLSGPGGLAALEASGIGAAGAPSALAAPTLGGAIVGIGGGFMAGTAVNSMLGGNSTNGQSGSGLGAIAGFMVGGPVGGLVGGAAGGAIGGLFGPKKRPGFYNLTVEAGADGMLAAGNAGQKRAGEQLAALQQQTQQQVAALNQQMQALGLRASGSVNLGANVGGANQLGGLGDVTTQIRLAANDQRIQSAIDRVGGGTFAGQLGAAQSADALIKQIEAFGQAARDATDPLGAVARQFDGVRETAEKLGFGLDEVTQAQERAVREATARLVAPVAGALDGIANYARSLRTANDNTGNPLSRLAAAEAEFERLSAAARGGDAAAIGRFQQAAEQFRGLSRDVFGTGQGFAANEGRIIAALEQIGNVSADTLTASALAAVQREQTDTLVTALAGVRDEVARLRREVQQAQRNPLAA
jgi:hypothetical protein